MRSAAEVTLRQWRVEGVLRASVLAALVAVSLVAAWSAIANGARRPSVVHLEFAGSPSAVTRDSLAALARAGRRVSWSGSLAPLAVMAEPLREPGVRWRLAAIGGAALLLRDSLGFIDSLGAAAAVTLEPTRGSAQVLQGSSVAATLPYDLAPPRGALVLGRVGWESRFIITALEEAGWRVDARLTLGRGRSVRQGDGSADIARHDVVIVTDSAMASDNAAVLGRFVRGGGGLILAAEAAGARAPAIRALVGARRLRREDPLTQSFEDRQPTQALPLFALDQIAADATVLEARRGRPAIVARRVEAGRVMQVGYADTWRWRMQGEGRSVEEHRAFWSRLAGLVARGERQPATHSELNGVAASRRPEQHDAAPLAALVHAIGPARAAAPAAAAGLPFPTWLGPVILLGLLAEWGLRRRRGAP